MINPDILLSRRIRQIRKKVKEIRNVMDNRFDEDEKEHEEEY